MILPFCLLAKGKQKVWVIDPGHGGNDHGCETSTAMEKDINLKLAKRVAELVRANIPNVKVILTREYDKYLTLDQRCVIANNADAELFLSIHVNAAPEVNTIRGTETFYGPQGGTEDKDLERQRKKNIQKSELLAWMMQKYYGIAGRPISRGVKRARYYVVLYTRMPAILTEVGFISTPSEEKYMTSKEGSEEMAQCIYRGLKDYDETVQKDKIQSTLAILRRTSGQSKQNVIPEAKGPEKLTPETNLAVNTVQTNTSTSLKNETVVAKEETKTEAKTETKVEVKTVQDVAVAPVTTEKSKETVKNTTASSTAVKTVSSNTSATNNTAKVQAEPTKTTTTTLQSTNNTTTSKQIEDKKKVQNSTTSTNANASKDLAIVKKEPEVKKENTAKSETAAKTETKAKQESTAKKAENAETPKVPVMPENNVLAGTEEPEELDEELLFSVQIFSLRAKLQPSDERFKGLKDLLVVEREGLYKYLCGTTKDYAGARKLLAEVRELFPDAFLVAYKGSRQIPMADAIEMLPTK